MRTLYIRFLLPIIAILIIATVMVITPFVMHTAGVTHTSNTHTITAPTKIARSYGN